MMFDRERFIKDLCEIAKKGVPFLDQGKSPETGMDCIHLPRYFYELQGLKLPEELTKEFEHYHDVPDGKRLLRIMRQWFQEIPIGEQKPADLLVIFARKNPQHVACLVGENEVVEAFKSATGHIRRVLKQPLDPRRKIAAVFRFPDA